MFVLRAQHGYEDIEDLEDIEADEAAERVERRPGSAESKSSATDPVRDPHRFRFARHPG